MALRECVMNRVFHKYIGQFVLVYIDDILVFSRTPEDHAQHLCLALQAIPETFGAHRGASDGISVDPEKNAAIRDWQQPATLKSLQAFLGLANYFRRFVPHYSSIVAPLTSITGRKAATFNWLHWGPAGKHAFEKIKHALTHAPVLAIPDLNAPFQVYTDAYLLGTGGVLMQNGRVVAYISAKYSSADFNYITGEQELLALYHALKAWRCYLEGSTETEILTAHHPLIFLQAQPFLFCRLACRMENFSRFPFLQVDKLSITVLAKTMWLMQRAEIQFLLNIRLVLCV
eukprot:1139199-Pelagomonas_calceolata.AAC.3